MGADSIAELMVRISADNDQLRKALEESRRDAKETKTSFVEMNQALELARKGFDLIKAVVGDSVREFMEAEAAQVKLNAILKATGESAGKTSRELGDMAERLSRVTIFDDDQITNAQALLLTFKSIRGEIYDRTLPIIMDLSSAFGMDLAGASVMVGKALEDPTNGLTALRRVGVSFTEQEQEQIKAMQAAGDTAGAQAAILEVLKGQVGGVAEAMGSSASGSIIKMDNAIKNLQESIGKLVTTSFQPMFDNVAKMAREWTSAFDYLNALFTAGTITKEQNAIAMSLVKVADGLNNVRTQAQLNTVLTTAKKELQDLEKSGYNIDAQFEAWTIKLKAARDETKKYGIDFGGERLAKEMVDGLTKIMDLRDRVTEKVRASAAPAAAPVSMPEGIAARAFEIEYRYAHDPAWKEFLEEMKTANQVLPDFAGLAAQASAAVGDDFTLALFNANGELKETPNFAGLASAAVLEFGDNLKAGIEKGKTPLTDFEKSLASVENRLKNTLPNALNTMISGPFTSLGAALKQGKANWDDFGTAGAHAFGLVVQALGAELAAEAAANLVKGTAAAFLPPPANLAAPGYFAAAAIESAGAVAAYTAAGALSAYAMGTNSARRGMAIVGEQGPELVNFGGGETVYNNQQTQQILGGGNFSPTVQIINPSQPSPAAAARQMRRTLQQMAWKAGFAR